MGTLWDLYQSRLRQKAEWLNEESSSASKIDADQIEPALRGSGAGDWIPRIPCHVCHGVRFWRSVHGAVACAECHPPAAPGLLAERGEACPAQDARERLHALLDRWAELNEALWTQEDINNLKDCILDFWVTDWVEADQWWLEWRTAHPHARLV